MAAITQPSMKNLTRRQQQIYNYLLDKKHHLDHPQPTTNSANPSPPLLGTIAAGRPIEAVPQPEVLQVPDELLGRNPCYVLKVARRLHDRRRHTGR